MNKFAKESKREGGRGRELGPSKMCKGERKRDLLLEKILNFTLPYEHRKFRERERERRRVRGGRSKGER